jgi:hypothetical protein
MQSNKILFIFILLNFIILSCDRPACSTDNEIFLKNEVTSKIYQNEVAKHIQNIGQEKLRFWLSDYFESEAKHYFVFYTQNEDLCAKAVVKVDADNNSFSEILKTKGKGRFNAEFRGLKLDLVKNEFGDTEFVYISHDRIID